MTPLSDIVEPTTTAQAGGWRVHLDDYEGPLDLLLHLVRRGQMDVMNVPIARLTADYLAYLDFMERVSIDTAGTFALMAATLVHIKSRALLPAPVDAAEGDEEDPRGEIMGPLLDYVKVKDAAEMLRQRELLDRDVFIRGQAELGEEAEEGELSTVSVFDLLDAFRTLLETRREEPLLVEVEQETVQERVGRLSLVLSRSGGMPFRSLFPGGATRREVIITFLALLEMVKGGMVRLIQDEGGEITVLPPLAGVA